MINIKINKRELSRKQINKILEDKNTINLSGMMSDNQIKQKRFDRKVKKVTRKVLKPILFAVFVIFMSLWYFGSKNILNANASEISVQESIRLERLKSCQEEYKKSGIKDMFIYEQLIIVRCATYMTLTYSYESDFGQSKMCRDLKNCNGMKGNGVNHPAGFIEFNSYKEGRDWFANRYFKYHYKKKINEFVDNWSMTDRKEYKSFMWNNYTNIYNELEYLYIN